MFRFFSHRPHHIIVCFATIPSADNRRSFLQDRNSLPPRILLMASLFLRLSPRRLIFHMGVRPPPSFTFDLHPSRNLGKLTLLLLPFFLTSNVDVPSLLPSFMAFTSIPAPSKFWLAETLTGLRRRRCHPLTKTSTYVLEMTDFLCVGNVIKAFPISPSLMPYLGASELTLFSKFILIVTFRSTASTLIHGFAID
ncbi:unnamed protein product [Lactuca saligna]|uniref:Uncharacterized protein n=1 Tax=Lactuca saligna TaxID=75948 RepID=A0AA35XZV5_LACSI|nr:unnamed protein product [Lactuca saligna]